MIVEDFNQEWTFAAADGPAVVVILPHDAMILEPRDRRTVNLANTGWYPGGRYSYSKTISAPAQWAGQHVSLLFEGVYHRSTVTLNGTPVGGRPSGYAEFRVALDDALIFGADNELVVTVDTSDGPNSRWYSGSGIYRPVWLEIESPVRVAHDGVRVRTLSVGDDTAPAHVEVDVRIDCRDDQAALDVVVQLHDQNGPVATSTNAPGVPHLLSVEEPRLWSDETPNLYDLVVQLRRGEEVLDERRERIGIRTITLDATQGLHVNGKPTLLRGACVHHDSGVLGAATFAAAEKRRARILKEVGFNAIRSGHTPISRALLDACDEQGLYVIDELTDVWLTPKTANDYAADFQAWWNRDLDSMIAKSRNHASVIAWSIGNENGETATEEGAAMGRVIADACRASDPTRPVTAGVNPTINAAVRVGKGLFDAGSGGAPMAKEGAPSAIGSALFNVAMNRLGPIMNHLARIPFVDRTTEEIFDTLDLAGYNYASGAYRVDGHRHPDRVIFGSETLPGDIARNWSLVEELPHVIGDFMWVGWDYLGEAGVGAWSYDSDRTALLKPYPFIASGGGAVDLTGQPGAMALHAQAAWGFDEGPGVTVRPLDRVTRPVVRSLWRTTDAISSWSWAGYEDTETEVLVFSSAHTVDLLLNGRMIGTRRAGREHNCIAKFNVSYHPGTLTAVARTASGKELGRTSLRTAGTDIALRLRADRTDLRADGQDLAFVEVDLADEAGTVAPLSGVAMRAEVVGAGVLAGFGSADPKPVDSYTNGLHRTYQGRALAVVRTSLAAGDVRVIVAADGFGERMLSMVAR